MPNPIIGNIQEECVKCGRRYPESKPACVYCGEPNPDHRTRNERFSNIPHTPVKEKLYVEKYEDEN